VLDIGHTTTGLVIYRDRRILATQTFEWGGFHITRDVAAGLQVSFEEAVELVMLYGVSERLIPAKDDTLPGAAPPEEERSAHIKLKSVVRGAPSIVERRELDMIIFERSQELMTKVRQYLHARGLAKHLIRGVVLTGGTAMIRNQAALAESVFQAPARVGLPEGINILPQPVNTPEFAPALGIIRHAFEYRSARRSGRIEITRGLAGTLLYKLWTAFRKYFF